MARLILVLLLFAALALALAAAVMALRALRAPPRPAPLPAVTEDRMPSAMRNVAYVVLLLLLAGLTSGLLGPA
jgi:hypothetical protein